MSAEPARDAHAELHALIDRLTDQQADDMLLRLKMETAPPSRPLNAREIAQIERSLNDSGRGRGMSTAELRTRFGLAE